MAKKKGLNKYNAPKIAMGTAFLLAVSKGTVGLMTGSIAIIGSAFDSMLDILTSAINFIMIKKADEPPDSDHPFGHGKFEAYASLLQSIIILAIGVSLLYGAYHKLKVSDPIDVTPLALGVMVLSILASLFITALLRHTAKKENSQALHADALHYAVDVAANACVLLALLAVKLTGLGWLDPVFGAVIAVYIMWSALKLHFDTLKIILDRRIPADKLALVQNALNKFKDYQVDYHRLRTRTDGSRIFADVHLTLCRKLTLQEAHDFVDILESEFPESSVDMMIHPEPCPCPGGENCRADAIRTLIKEYAGSKKC